LCRINPSFAGSEQENSSNVSRNKNTFFIIVEICGALVTANEAKALILIVVLDKVSVQKF